MNDSLIERMKRYADDATACTPEVAQVLREAALRMQSKIDMTQYKGCFNCASKCYFCMFNETEMCRKCKGYNKYKPYVKFCPDCGKPMTEEARQELEKRLDG